MKPPRPLDTPETKLPRHERTRPPFSEFFERDHEQTIGGMDQEGSDIPMQAPRTPLRLKRVGMRREAIPVLMADPLGVGEAVQISCSVEAFVGLEAARRGIHVSRIGDLLARLAERTFLSLGDYAGQLNEALRETQASPTAFVAVQGILTYRESVGGRKGKVSLEHLELRAGADFENGRLRSSIGVGFHHLTACPCVQETYRHSFEPGKPILHPEREGKQIPLMTHSQRCRTRLTIAGTEETPALSELLGCIDAVLVRSQNTLPREVELLNVFRAHAQAQFIEDAQRDLLREVYRVAARRSRVGTISLASTSMESIHDFDLQAEIEYSFEELAGIFGAP